jgi:large subunit ribosomal protein L13
MTKYTIDAENKRLGRIASEVAVLLMGKNLSSFAKNNVAEVSVGVKNASKMQIDSKKIAQETFSRYSGYPGGLKKPNMEKVISTKGFGEVLKFAVSGMLPKNKLRDKMLKNLKVTE